MKQNQVIKTLSRFFKKRTKGQQTAIIIIGGLIVLSVLQNPLPIAFAGVLIFLIYQFVKKKFREGEYGTQR